jgi:hypothetical protein
MNIAVRFQVASRYKPAQLTFTSIRISKMTAWVDPCVRQLSVLPSTRARLAPLAPALAARQLTRPSGRPNACSDMSRQGSSKRLQYM